ncbi:eukaryotic rRNA processing protein EBP2-domain-containing protein [Xylogone sp. PMI_703]|nr:eukaryotic rRNA processing protein EBP2-domain-containing protein [Xylogone sp. PMI_703]
MVTKSKLKMALAADKGVDFGKLKLKKKEKAAKKSKSKANKEQEWEDVDEDEEEGDEEDGGVELTKDDQEQQEGSSDEEEEIDGPMQVDFEGINESDSDSSTGEEDEDEEASDEEDIPMSDLEDLSETEKEDIIPHQRLTINNTTALTASLKRIALPISSLPFSEHQSVTTSEPVSIPDVSDDLNRELAFYAQSLSAVKTARQLLKAEGVPFSRPKDYFAEMVKADEHMAKIKAKLVDEAARKKASAEAKKQRDLKKFGKQVQIAKLQEREKDKKATLEKIKTLKRKRQDQGAAAGENEADLFDVAVEDEISKPSRKDRQGPNKRQKKDEKFGFGGKKRFAKSNDAMSSSDLRGFSSRKMKGKAGGPKQRPGKSRRANKK